LTGDVSSWCEDILNVLNSMYMEIVNEKLSVICEYFHVVKIGVYTNMI
jgi:hypothetical protein